VNEDVGGEPIVRDLTDHAGLTWTVRRFEPTLGRSLGQRSGSWPVVEASGPWLTFECVQTGWLRRLAPVPEDWDVCDAERLLAYFESARHVRQRPRSGPLP
jgi:hypothetical protein